MEKVRLIYASCFIVPLLCSIEANPISTTAISIPAAVITEMKKHDPDINQTCEYIRFFSESDLTKTCTTLQYPQNTYFNYHNVTTFLCVAIYDGLYKVCNYSRNGLLQRKLKDTASFTSDVQRIISKVTKKQEQLVPMLCGYFSNVTATYNMTKPIASQMMDRLHDSYSCQDYCIDATSVTSVKVVPLCAVLAWIEDIDRVVKKDVILSAQEQGKSINKPVPNVQEMTETHTVPKSVTAANSATNGNQEHDPIKKKEEHNSNEKKEQPTETGHSEKQPNDSKTQSTELQNKNVPTIVESSGTKNQDTSKKNVVSNNPQPVNAQEAVEATSNIKSNKQPAHNGQTSTLSEDPPAVSHKKQADQTQGSEHTKNTIDASSKKKVDDPVDEKQPMVDDKDAMDVNKGEIAEDTQDHDDNPSQGDINQNMDDAVNFDDPPDAIGDTGVQNQDQIDPSEQREYLPHYRNIRTDEDSHFFTYFTVVSLVCVAGYIGYHNKQKILAIVVEGRRSKNNRGRRRPSTASYRKLDCTLEEAVTSQCNANVTHVIY